MFAVPATPAEAYREKSVQKVEQDVHACDVRWSRGTRLFLDYSPKIETIEDVAALFPVEENFPGMQRLTPQTKRQSLDAYYWQSSYRGHVTSGLEYKITFTIMYSSIEDAFTDGSKPKKDGEFSFRLFGRDNGFSRDFRERDLKDRKSVV